MMFKGFNIATENTLKNIFQIVYNNFARKKDVVELKQHIKDDVTEELKDLTDNLKKENQKAVADIKTLETSTKEKSEFVGTKAQEISQYAQEVKDNFTHAQELQQATKKLQESTTATEEEAKALVEEFKKIRESLSAAVLYKGSVDTYADLPSSAKLGWMYNIKKEDKTRKINADDNLIWNGESWDNMGGFIDVDDILNGSKNATFGNVKANSFTGKLVGNADTATTANNAKSVDWSNVQNKPATYPATAHNHDSAYPSTTGTRASGTWGINISGNANTSNAPLGLSRGTASSWGKGNGIGTWVTGWANNGAEIAFRNNSGQLNVVIDGQYYANEGNSLVLNEGNYNNYAPTKTGGGASGTWGINVTGSAGSVAWGNVTGKPATYPATAHNHDSAYPSTTGTRASGTWGISVTGNAGSATRLPVRDTRAANKTPQQCMTDYSNGLHPEFKQKTTIGIGGSGTYAGVLTFNQWQDSSGGWPSQIACDPQNGRMYYRWGTSGTAWSSWKTIAYTDDKPATAGTADVAKSANAVAWGNVTGKPSLMGTGGGTFTGNITMQGNAKNIYYHGSKASNSMIRFIDNTGDPYGNGISIGGGGLTIVGAGEGAQAAEAKYTYGGDETLILASDGVINFYTRTDGGIDKAWHGTIDTNGLFSGKAATAGTADTAKSVAWGNVSGRPGNATTSAAGFMTAADKSKLNKVGNAIYTTTSTGAAKIKVNINAQNAWMLNFTLVLYQDYVAKKIMISGYNYGNNHWYSPAAKLIASSNDSAVNVYFGYDAVNKLWVAVDGGSYTGVAITDVCNGYQEISDYTGLFTITRIASLTGTLQTTVTPGIPIHSGNYNSYAPTKTGGGASGTWGINVTGSAGSVAWGNVSGKPAQATRWPSWGEVTGKPGSMPANGGTASYANRLNVDCTNELCLNGAFAGGYLWFGYRCDGLKSAITEYKFGNGMRNSGLAQVTASQFNGKLNGSCTGSAGSVAWNNVTGRPSVMEPTFNNGKWYNVGDDVKIGDFNHAGLLGICGLNAATGIGLAKRGAETNIATITYDGGNIVFNKTLQANITGNASSASSVAWSGVSGKPAQATRWPSFAEVTGKPTLAKVAGWDGSTLSLQGV